MFAWQKESLLAQGNGEIPIWSYIKSDARSTRGPSPDHRQCPWLMRVRTNFTIFPPAVCRSDWSIVWSWTSRLTVIFVHKPELPARAHIVCVMDYWNNRGVIYNADMIYIKSRLAGGLPEVDNLALVGGLHVMIFIGRKCGFDLSIRTWSKTINNITTINRALDRPCVWQNKQCFCVHFIGASSMVCCCAVIMI